MPLYQLKPSSRQINEIIKGCLNETFRIAVENIKVYLDLLYQRVPNLKDFSKVLNPRAIHKGACGFFQYSLYMLQLGLWFRNRPTEQQTMKYFFKQENYRFPIGSPSHNLETVFLITGGFQTFFSVQQKVHHSSPNRISIEA